MTRSQKSPLMAASKKFKKRKRKKTSNIRESDTEIESAIATEFGSTTQNSVNTISTTLSVEILKADRKLDDINSVCVKIETDEWYNTATDFYSAFAISEQVLEEEMHPDCKKQDGFNLVPEQTGCLQMEHDYTKQDGFASESMKSEKTEYEVMHPCVTRQACVHTVCVNKNTTSNSDVYTALDELHSVFGKAKGSLNLNTGQSYITTNDLNYVSRIANQYINTDTGSGNTTTNNHNALCDHTYSKTPDNQAKLAELNSVYLTREEMELSNVDQYCAGPTVGVETIKIDHYSKPYVPRHSNSDKDDSENDVTRKQAKMKLNEKADRVKKVKVHTVFIRKKAKTPEKDKTEYSLQERNPASCMNLEPPDNDNFLYCGECTKEFEGDCPVHGPYKYIQDKEVPEGDPLKADNTLPDCLEIRMSKIAGAGLGVFSKEGLESKIMFGPYVGAIIINNHKSGYCWQTYKDGKASNFVDAQNQATSNWMRYVNCAITQADRNLVSLSYKGGIYYCTLKPVSPGEELLVWYCNEFAREFGPIRDKNLCSYSSKNSCHFKTCIIHTGERPYKCKVCSKAFNQSCHLKTHMRIHTGERPYKCEVCGKAFNQSGDLKTHMSMHTVERPYKCEVCGKAFNQSGDLTRHMMKHTEERLYTCEVCGYACNKSCDLKTHMMIHTGERLYKCEVCCKAFYQRSNLKTHMRSIHSGERPYKCEVCGKAFYQRGNLKTHIRIHTGERPYKCEVCGKAFNQSGDLKTHKRRIHTGERLNKCEVCGYLVKHSGHLKTHMMIHTGERPYKCKVCGYAYKQSGHWKRHMKIHKGETVQV